MTDDRGQGLALVIILTAFIFVMGSAAVALATSLRRNTGSEIRQKKANYIAEAGIEKAVPIIRCGQLSLEDLDSDEGLDLVPDYISPNYAGGLIEYVRVSGENGNENEIILLIESLGTYQEACCTLQAGSRWTCPWILGGDYGYHPPWKILLFFTPAAVSNRIFIPAVPCIFWGIWLMVISIPAAILCWQMILT